MHCFKKKKMEKVLNSNKELMFWIKLFRWLFSQWLGMVSSAVIISSKSGCWEQVASNSNMKLVEAAIPFPAKKTQNHNEMQFQVHI